MTLKSRVIWTEYRPATASMIITFDNNILYTMTSLFAGQIVTIPAKTTCANRKTNKKYYDKIIILSCGYDL